MSDEIMTGTDPALVLPWMIQMTNGTQQFRSEDERYLGGKLGLFGLSIRWRHMVRKATSRTPRCLNRKIPNLYLSLSLYLSISLYLSLSLSLWSRKTFEKRGRRGDAQSPFRKKTRKSEEQRRERAQARAAFILFSHSSFFLLLCLAPLLLPSSACCSWRRAGPAGPRRARQARRA